jgi:hypothetical protein
LTRYCISAAAQASASFCAAAAGARSERHSNAHRRLGALVDQVRRLRQQVRSAQAHFGVLETVKQIRIHLDADLVSQIAKRQAAVGFGGLRAVKRRAEDRKRSRRVNLRRRGTGERRARAKSDKHRAHRAPRTR